MYQTSEPPYSRYPSLSRMALMSVSAAIRALLTLHQRISRNNPWVDAHLDPCPSSSSAMYPPKRVIQIPLRIEQMLRLDRTWNRCLARTRHFRQISKHGTNVLATSSSAMSESYCLRDPTLKRKLPHPRPVTSASKQRLRRSFKGRFLLGERLSHWN